MPSDICCCRPTLVTVIPIMISSDDDHLLYHRRLNMWRSISCYDFHGKWILTLNQRELILLLKHIIGIVKEEQLWEVSQKQRSRIRLEYPKLAKMQPPPI
jgi:hypothetical protein